MNIKLILVVLVIVILVWVANTQENFGAEELSFANPITKPVLYDRETGSVMSGSEFISLPDEVMPAWGVGRFGILENHDGEEVYFGDKGDDIMGMQYNMCSKSCCSQQYPVPFELDHDAMVCENKDKFVPNSYKCNNSWQDSGCMCMTKDQRDFLAARGNNA